MMRMYAVPERAFKNAAKAFLRDPTRPINPLDFFTLKERMVLLFTSITDVYYEDWLVDCDYD